MIVLPLCFRCRHYRDGEGDEHACRAFESIPREILLCEADHRKPFPGDKGVRFEPRPEGKPDER